MKNDQATDDVQSANHVEFLSISPYLSVSVRQSRKSSGTFQLSLFQKSAGAASKNMVYSRYFQSRNMAGAKTAVRTIIARWARKQPAPPDGVRLEEWAEILDAFGVEG